MDIQRRARLAGWAGASLFIIAGLVGGSVMYLGFVRNDSALIQVGALAAFVTVLPVFILNRYLLSLLREEESERADGARPPE